MTKHTKTIKQPGKVPLNQSFFLMSIIGFIISAGFTMSGKLDATWGFTFSLIFVIMFIASIVSMTPDVPKN
jgi:hypothetical protein